MPFDQRDAACRCEWGPRGLVALAPADVVIVVDTLSFSTCVDVAVGRGAAIFPYAWRDATAADFAAGRRAILAGPRGGGGYSLSPASFRDAPRDLRCVLPSPNGAALALRAHAMGVHVLAGCLRNAPAVAAAALRRGRTFNVCPAGERWPDGSLRPALEDWLAAGAILRHLPGPKSPEAAAAVVAFEGSRDRLAKVLADAGSGRELIARGYAIDVEVAAEHAVSEHAPRFDGEAFVAEQAGGL